MSKGRWERFLLHSVIAAPGSCLGKNPWSHTASLVSLQEPPKNEEQTWKDSLVLLKLVEPSLSSVGAIIPKAEKLWLERKKKKSQSLCWPLWEAASPLQFQRLLQHVGGGT